ncbi:formimidoylglutamate deiminase [Ideonella azotifigens]|uniref:Formimidoylglutamate deiminase n=1 Tax=Ideonella azotifigens TaxID=513160 RepID=A0ABP3VDG7_9BURK|nr:formimidoylglutamate deiminase [Ideonella azotifigens]MCD2341731.1 formimidoylglutamate deiminase [Ideonella azotifigens]
MSGGATSPTVRRFWAPRAWLPEGWREEVLLEVDAHGRWSRVVPGQPCPPDAERLAGLTLPGLVNGHSHAFQRAFAGLAERREAAADNFWSWRDRMYRVAGKITPDQLRAVATQLYAELLRGGYTQVCEFHYLHHAPGGKPYGAPMAMTQSLIDAAADVGIGLTVLPVLYERAGFDQPMLRPDQQRFRLHAEGVLNAHQSVQERTHACLNAGLAVHSLRAARPASLHTLARMAEQTVGPVHIHVAEQTAEVQDCLQATGRRPVEYLASEGLLDARWQLVHATHINQAEIMTVAYSGSAVVICPSTEGNLGDGLTDLPGWLQAEVPISLGSDSHVSRCWREELRWLEYGQRLGLRQRNVAAAPERGQPSTAERLWRGVLDGGRMAAGFPLWGLTPGARADLLVADPRDTSLAGIPAARSLDALIFSSPTLPWRDVMVAGQWKLREQQMPGSDAITSGFVSAMEELWS